MASSSFATPVSVVEAAFDQIMADVDAPVEAIAKLRPQFIDAHRSGNPRKEREVVKSVLVGTVWGEAYFGRWRERFASERAYPYMWRSRGKALISDEPDPPATIHEAIKLLRVADMRKLLVATSTMPDKGRPKRRSEYTKILLATGNRSELVDAAMPAHLKACQKWSADREAAKCELLAHTITMRAYFLRDRRRLAGAPTLRALYSDCPVETAYAAKFLAGEIAGDPPFFPGDRTALTTDRHAP